MDSAMSMCVVCVVHNFCKLGSFQNPEQTLKNRGGWVRALEREKQKGIPLKYPCHNTRHICFKSN